MIEPWRNGNLYKSLLNIDKAGWAWTWLSRNLSYQDTVAKRPPMIQFHREDQGLRLISAPDLSHAAYWGLSFRGNRPKTSR
jgi:hypothetical protein